MKKWILTLAALLAAAPFLRAQNDTLQLGYGLKQSKQHSSLAADAVGREALSLTDGWNVLNALYGQVPGLLVRQGASVPWSCSPTLVVRGWGSFNGNDPLILVDGIQRDPGLLSPVEVENVTVLRDAASTALYGLRGADGVILITTRRGQGVRQIVSADYTFGVQTPFRLPAMADASRYAYAVNEALALDGLEPRFTQTDLQRLASGQSVLPLVDWRKEVLRSSGFTHDANLSVEGADRRIRYFIAANLAQSSGILANTGLNDGYSTQVLHNTLKLRSNLDIRMTPTTLVRVGLSGRLLQYQQPLSGSSAAGPSLQTLFDTPPIATPLRKDGRWVRAENFDNPLARMAAGGYTAILQRALLADLSIEQDLRSLIEGLKLTVLAGYDNSADIADRRSYDYEYYVSRYLRDDSGHISDLGYTLYGNTTGLAFTRYLDGQFMRSSFQGRLSYDRQFGAHAVDAALIYAQTGVKYSGANNRSAYMDGIAAASYGYGGRYFLSAVAACSGSARLQAGSKFRLYPAASAAWLVSAEPWMEGASSWLHLLKVRGSYGLSGFDGRLAYDLDKQFNGEGSSFVFNGTTVSPGLTQGSLPSTGILPEEERKADLGLELDLGGVFTLQADVFDHHRHGLMVSGAGSYSSVIGVGLPYIFTGETRNRGAEGAADLHLSSGIVSAHLGGTFTFAKSRILEMSEAYHPYDYMYSTGHPIGSFYGLIADGFYTEGDFGPDGKLLGSVPASTFVESVRPGDVKYKDMNGDAQIDAYDYACQDASTVPLFWYGLQAGLKVGSFGVEALFDGAGGFITETSLSSVYQPLYGDSRSVSVHYLDDAWHAGAENARYPRLTTLSNANNFAASRVWTEKGDFLKLRNLYLFYDLPAEGLRALRMSGLRVFLRGTNLFSVDAVRILDPERISLSYPSMRTFQAGIKCSF